MQKTLTTVAALSVLLSACYSCHDPTDESSPAEDQRTVVGSGTLCVITEGISETSGADDYESSSAGTPHDGIITAQEVINFWYHESGSTDWNNVVVFAQGYGFDLNAFDRQWDDRAAAVPLETLCGGRGQPSEDLRERLALPSESDFHTHALAYAIRWVEDRGNCAEAYIPRGIPDDPDRYSLGDSLDRIGFGDGITGEERGRIQRLVTEDELREAFESDSYGTVYQRLQDAFNIFTEDGECDGRDLVSIGEHQFRTLQQSFAIALAVSEQDVLFPVVDRGLISYNFAQKRDNRRQHAATDIYTRGEGRVQAMSDGMVVANSNDWLDSATRNFKTCSGEQTGFVTIAHPEIGLVITYAELDKEDATGWQAGDTVRAGETLGTATRCGMAHIEVYRTNPGDYIKWFISDSAAGGQISIDNEDLATIPSHLVDGSPLFYLLEKKL
jgi:murein DD-endopeptidase MepM/ murein hydrolase activator NlpD